MPYSLPLGTLVNVASVILGSLIGLALQQVFSEEIKEIVFQAIGLGTILIGINMSLKLPDGYMLLLIFSLIVGGIMGELIHLDQLILELSESLKTLTGSTESRFSEGLITAFLLFCIGSMTILGAIEEGLSQKRDLLYVKSTLDGFSSIALSASLGVGVLFSVIPMLVFQGGLTLIAGKIQKLFDADTLGLISAVGGLLIIGISINILGLGNINLEKLLPSIFVSILMSKARRRWFSR